MSNAHRTPRTVHPRPPRTVHPRPHSHFTELENGTLDHLTQSQLVRVASSALATLASEYDLRIFDDSAADFLLKACTVVAIDPPWGAAPLLICRTWGVRPPSLRDESNESSVLSPAVRRRRVARRGDVPVNIRRPDLAEVH